MKNSPEHNFEIQHTPDAHELLAMAREHSKNNPEKKEYPTHVKELAMNAMVNTLKKAVRN